MRGEIDKYRIIVGYLNNITTQKISISILEFNNASNLQDLKWTFIEYSIQ